MKVPFLDLSREHEPVREALAEAADRVLRSGWYILGPELEALEAEFAERVGAAHAIGVGSGTDALHLALRACGVERGDKVLTSAHTAAPTVCAIQQAEAVPVLVDIDAGTMTIDPDRLAACLKSHPKAKAVLPVHLYGHPSDMDAILQLADRNAVTVIEDAAQAHGARHRGRPVGTIGAAGCFSFYPTKNLGACGDAGMVVTDDAATAHRVRRLRNYGEVSKYRNAGFGVNSRLDEMQAAILRAKLPFLDEWNAARRRIADRYRTLLRDAPLRLPEAAAWAGHVYHLFVVRHERRDALQAALLQDGIGTSIHYPRPIHFQKAWHSLGSGPGSFPVAEQVCAECLSLPMSPRLSDAEVDTVVAAIRDFDRQKGTAVAASGVRSATTKP